MIKSVQIRNFKSILCQDIELERLTVFVGANASGKTSVLDALNVTLRGFASDSIRESILMS